MTVAMDILHDRESKHYTLYAHPDKGGFFGLSALHNFNNSVLEPYSKAQIDETLILDFSLVKVWDISALLWLTIALHHYRRVGLPFILRLPEGKQDMSDKERDEYDKSADYLRRWKFYDALLNISMEPSELLVPEQHAFFSTGGPLRFYKDYKQPNESGLMEAFMSRRLFQIWNLSDPKTYGATNMSQHISEHIQMFQSKGIGNILCTQCGIKKRDADLFADHLLTEALLNVCEHPNATIGLIAISIMGKTKELVLCIADNGDSIPETIHPTYRDNNPDNEATNSQYNRDLSTKDKASLADYATQKNVTRKSGDEAKGAGMGLTYIKEDTLSVFKGKFRIITDQVSLKHEGKDASSYVEEEWKHPWKGNLLRIAIPIPDK
ncbi:ATP-binding region, ATPase-like domain protein [Candidatus Magnetobacterium bavaricum]|uniref:ATP-binding region, ATPase-like domain protein n=1 Tax=Candidatus Magnetobacterium bavaricum TaxID=29290 RepID=A0A0F3GY50_9BACT|nr:ATP-binding region, ATPase-like domain protein [Candidatus Magnetobacterium bavaricum]